MIIHNEQGEHMGQEEQAEIKAWHTRLHSEFNKGWVDLDQLRLITTDTAEDPARVQAAYQLLDELQKKGKA